MLIVGVESRVVTGQSLQLSSVSSHFRHAESSISSTVAVISFELVFAGEAFQYLFMQFEENVLSVGV